METPRVTAFQAKVYAMCRRIPRGTVTTYAALAKVVDCGSPRAVGQALRHNPFAPEVPCHRVIASDLSLGGFSGQREGPALQHKVDLLRGEGVRFEDGHHVDPDCLFHFETE